MSESTDRTERMTGTPSKDRAEAQMDAADTLVACINVDCHDRADQIEHAARALANAFAEGMKRAAEIAHMFRNRDTGRAIEEAILAELREAK